MRAVALSNENVQDKVATSFVPLQVQIDYGTETFPLDWPALKVWQDTYRRMGGPKTTGITACSVVAPELDVELGSTGSAFVWEMFDSIAYDASKFAAMLDNSLERLHTRERIRNDASLSEDDKQTQLAKHQKEVKEAVGKEGRFRFPPWGFSIEGAKELFRMTGDLMDKPPIGESPSTDE